MFCHVREYLHKRLIHIQKVSTDDQYNDTWTKPFPQNIFFKASQNYFPFLIYDLHFSVSAELGSVTMYEIVSLLHYFYGDIQSMTWELIF